MRKITISIFTIIFICSLFTGCKARVVNDDYSLKEITGDIKCEYRIGKNAKFADTAVNTDLVFDKDMFVKLFTEYNSFDPIFLKKNLDQYDFKINVEAQPDIWATVFNSEFNIKALFDDTFRSVSIYQYESKLYYFVLSMGGNSKPDEEGYYYMELSKEMDDYWRPIIEEVLLTTQY